MTKEPVANLKQLLDLMDRTKPTNDRNALNFDASYERLFQPWNTTREQSYGSANATPKNF